MKHQLVQIILFTLLFTACNQKEIKESTPDNIQNEVKVETEVSEDTVELYDPFSDTIIRAIEGPNWLDFKYDDARIYLYGLQSKDYYKNPSIIIDGKLNKTVFNKEGIKLNQSQIELVNNVLSGRYYSNDDNIRADCFFPHHGIVFYKSKKPVGYISICIMCNQLESFPKEGYFDRDQLSNLIKEVNLPIFKNPMEANEYGKK